MRAFIAIALPPECRAAIARAVSQLRASGVRASWTTERNLHLTLKFLGEIAAGRIDELAARMEEGARNIPPFSFGLAEAGAFPSFRAPRVLWIGIREPLELAGKLHQNMENALAGAGIPRDDRPFHPHVTVARIKGRVAPDWGETVASALSATSFGAVFATSYGLYESRLSASGATYTMIREVPFGGGADRQGTGGEGE